MKLSRATTSNLHLPQGKSEFTYFNSDIGGFGIRIRESGSRRWVFQYDIAGKTKQITIGKCTAIDAAKARQIASELHAKVELGQDPAAMKAENRARAEETFGATLKPYLQWQRSRVRPSTMRHIERHLVVNCAPLHSLPINKVDRRAIATQLTRMANSPVQANRTRSSLTGFLNWASREGLIETNAALSTNKNQERPRERVLTASEIEALWNALPKGDFGDILKILLLTAQRAHEISDLQWNEISLDKGVIELPAHRTKNRRRHIVPISTRVRGLLEARPQDRRVYVFGASDTSGFSGWSKAKARLDKALKIPPWTIHDIRRSAATGMAEIGIQPHIIEAVLNHVSGHKGGVAGIYNRAAYEADKATALMRWAEHVAAIIEDRDSNVPSLQVVS